MSIKTSTFLGWRLSGETADAFLDNLHNAKPSKRVKATLHLGNKLMKEYREKGYVILGSNKKIAA